MTEFDQGQEFLCHNRILLCRDRVWPWMGFLCRDKKFKDMGFPCRDIAFYVTTEGHSVTLQQGRACERQRHSVAHDRTWAHSVAPCCIMT